MDKFEWENQLKNRNYLNWVIKNTSKFDFYTDLGALLKPIQNDLQNLKWLVTDFEVNSSDMSKLSIDSIEDSFFISEQEMKIISSLNIQFMWGVFSALASDLDLDFNKIELPFAEGNKLVWKNDIFQLAESVIEITAWDSSLTIIKFKQKKLSDKFKSYFREEAVSLEKFNNYT